MLQRKIALFLCLTALASIGGVSCIRPWQVLRQAQPNPFKPNDSFVIRRIRFKGMRIGPYSFSEYMSQKNDTDRENWRIIIDNMRTIFSDNFLGASTGISVRQAQRANPNEFEIVPTVSFIEPGLYTYILNQPSEVHLRLLILQRGQIVDEVLLRSQTMASALIHPSIASRLRRDAANLGRHAGSYLKHRILQ